MADPRAVSVSAGNAETPIASRPGRIRRDLRLLTILLLLTAGLRAWQVSHTEVPARDSIGFIREAWRLRGGQPWADVIRSSEQHPGYPAVLLALSYPVRSLVRGTDADTMQLSAQLVSALASVLLVFPTFYLGKVLFNRTVGFWATLLFQCLPTSSRIMADGLSEGTFLLFAGTSLLLAVLALRGQSKILFGLTGITSGLAYLTRPEGVVIVAATGLVLAAIQLKRSSQRTWGQMLACGLSLVLGLIVVAGPFMRTIHGFTLKNTGIQITAARMVSPAPMPPDQKEKKEPQSQPTPLEASQQGWASRLWESQLIWGLRKLVLELEKGFFYVAWLPALLALWWYRGRLARNPGHWVLLLVAGVLLLLLYRVASYMRYLSDRHALLVIYCGCFWSAVGFLAIGRKLAHLTRVWSERPERRAAIGIGPRFARDPYSWSGIGLIALIAAAVVKDVEPLHANRKGFRDAGVWIAEHTAPYEEIVDPYCWTHYYAGRVFEEGKAHDIPSDRPKLCYVVVEESGNEHPRLGSSIPEAKRLALQGQKAFECKARRKLEICDVCVYAVPLPDKP